MIALRWFEGKAGHQIQGAEICGVLPNIWRWGIQQTENLENRDPVEFIFRKHFVGQVLVYFQRGKENQDE
jgi:hypothetical protein